MKLSEIASKYSIVQYDFEHFLRSNHLEYNEGVFSISVPDSKVDEYVQAFLEDKESKKDPAIRQAEQAEREELARKNLAMSQMLISSGFNFDGYTITKYSGYISGDDATEIPRAYIAADKRNNITDALVKIRRRALYELKEAAYNLGCNAVVGVDFDYLTLDPETSSLGSISVQGPYIICVTANGNAVVIEKNK